MNTSSLKCAASLGYISTQRTRHSSRQSVWDRWRWQHEILESIERRGSRRADDSGVIYRSLCFVRADDMRLERTIRTCEECGVEFIGKPRQRFCPMCLHEHYLQAKRRLRNWLVENGWCVDCGRKAAEGRVRCESCLEKCRSLYSNRYSKDYRRGGEKHA